MDNQSQQVADAFSRKATLYDEFGQDHPNLTRMRQIVREQVLRFLQPDDAILELNAGTGGDALFFAQRGYRVHTTDFSPGMLTQIRHKIDKHNLSHRLTVQDCSFADLDQVEHGPFQHIFSNMGGLNCIPDLRQVTRHLPQLLIPGGVVTWVIMPPTCLWDMAAVFRSDFKTARRRFGANGVLAHVEGIYFQTYYFTPRQVISAFGDEFELAALQGLSVFTPTADVKQFAWRFPKLYRILVQIDQYLAPHWPFYRLGDFFILSMRWRG